jgi:hypothetical protein
MAVDFTRATGLTPEVEEAVDCAFEYHHPKWNEKQIKDGKTIRDALETAVNRIVELVPPGPDRAVAIRKIRDARMDCNCAIAFGERL